MLKEERIGRVRVFEDVLNEANKGTVGTGVSAAEKGTGSKNLTVLTVNFTFAGGFATGTTASANDANGHLIYTFPAGDIVVDKTYIKLALVDTVGTCAADTPDLGLGTTKASGAQAVLSDVGATAEDLMTGQTMNNCSGTNEQYAVTSLTPNIITSAGAHTVYLNVADGWAAGGTSAMVASGTVILEWTKAS